MIPIATGRAAGGALRIGMNRDESRLRSKAHPPEVSQTGGRAAIYPVDPDGGGTWIAASDAGLLFALMNRYPEPLPTAADHSLLPEAMEELLRRRAPESRGQIIPRLLPARSLDEALELYHRLDPRQFGDFRLLILGEEAALEASNVDRDNIVRHRLDQPLLFTSSGLGDDVVETARRRLFEAWRPGGWDRTAQDAFHRHSWPDQPQLSVCMRRPDACTVSYTAVERGPEQVRMDYFDAPPDENVSPVTVVLNTMPRVATAGGVSVPDPEAEGR